jgi:hypothetical protein
MLLKYARKQRASIYHHATIEDLPFEVLREAFLYLEPADLDSPSRVNRSWRPAAQDVQRAQLMISPWGFRKSLDASFLCGIQLTRIVFGYEAYSIKHLELNLRSVNRDYIPAISRLISPTLLSLELDFEEEEESGVCYSILDEFFSQCQGIRNLKLRCFDFGYDSSSFSQTIKDGFYRLFQLSLDGCRGDLRMFVVSVPIHNLHSFNNGCFGETAVDSDIVSAVAINYPSIKRLRLDDLFNSSATIIKFVQCCRDIEDLFLNVDEMELTRSDIEAIASLPRLKSLNINCEIASGAVSALSRCRGLKHLAVDGFESFDLISILTSVRNLVSLECIFSTPFMEAIDAIIEHCPNLQMLNLGYGELGVEKKDAAVDLLKGGLKNLSKLTLNKVSVRLGTDWKGYLR